PATYASPASPVARLLVGMCGDARDRGKRSSVMRRHSVARKRGSVRFGAVAFVIREAILGKLSIERAHQRIAMNLGADRRQRDREAGCITPNDGLMAALQLVLVQPERIDQNEGWPRF